MATVRSSARFGFHGENWEDVRSMVGIGFYGSRLSSHLFRRPECLIVLVGRSYSGEVSEKLISIRSISTDVLCNHTGISAGAVVDSHREISSKSKVANMQGLHDSEV